MTPADRRASLNIKAHFAIHKALPAKESGPAVTSINKDSTARLKWLEREYLQCNAVTAPKQPDWFDKEYEVRINSG